MRLLALLGLRGGKRRRFSRIAMLPAIRQAIEDFSSLAIARAAVVQPPRIASVNVSSRAESINTAGASSKWLDHCAGGTSAKMDSAQ